MVDNPATGPKIILPLNGQAPTVSLGSDSSIQTKQRQLQQELDDIEKNEGIILGKVKELLAAIRGVETRKQTLTKELQNLQTTVTQLTGDGVKKTLADSERLVSQLSQTVRPAPAAAVSVVPPPVVPPGAQLQALQQEKKLKEAAAFANYNAGGMDSTALAAEIERINSTYGPLIIQASASSTAPLQPVALTPIISKLATALSQLDSAQTLWGKYLLVERPASGQPIYIQRAGDGIGIIVADGPATNFSRAKHFSDADVLRAGLTADDVRQLETSQLTAGQLPAEQ